MKKNLFFDGGVADAESSIIVAATLPVMVEFISSSGVSSFPWLWKKNRFMTGGGVDPK